MEQYSIYCTKEQTKLALELGAPIDELDNEVALQDRMSLGVGIPSFGRFDDYANEDEYPHITIIDVEDVRYAYYIPTAEEMLGWLETQGIKININYSAFEDSLKFKIHKAEDFEYEISWGYHYTSRKEVTLAAIDAALDYLGSHQK